MTSRNSLPLSLSGIELRDSLESFDQRGDIQTSSFSSELLRYEVRLIHQIPIEEVKALHDECLPVKYDDSFYQQVGKEAVQAIALVDPDNGNKLVGIITTQTKPVSQSEECGGLLAYNWIEEDILTYILTLCVSTEYRRQGIATKLLEELIYYCVNGDSGYSTVRRSHYTSPSMNNIPSAPNSSPRGSHLKHSDNPSLNPFVLKKTSAIYLHVLSSNDSAIEFYEKHHFQRIRILRDYYLIDNRNYDAYLYALYINDGKPPVSTFQRVSSWILSSGNLLTHVLNWVTFGYYKSTPSNRPT